MPNLTCVKLQQATQLFKYINTLTHPRARAHTLKNQIELCDRRPPCFPTLNAHSSRIHRGRACARGVVCSTQCFSKCCVYVRVYTLMFAWLGASEKYGWEIKFFLVFLIVFQFYRQFANGASPTYPRPSGLCHVWSGLWVGVGSLAKENNKQVLQSRF